MSNTPGGAGGPGGRDRKLALKSRKKNSKISFFWVKNKNYKKYFFSHISSSYNKILGETNFHTSGSKAKDREKKKKRKERKTERW